MVTKQQHGGRVCTFVRFVLRRLFINRFYRSVSGSLGSFVARARAGPGNVTYKLGDDAGKKFAINSTTGKITVQAHLDREVCMV